MLSPGPLTTKIPFVTLEDILVRTNDVGQLVLSLESSNQTLVPPRTKLQFGNCYYFVSSEEEVLDFIQDSKKVRDYVATAPQELKRYYTVGPKDFNRKVLPPVMREGKRYRERLYSFSDTTDLVLPEHKDLYVVVISYVDYKSRIRIGNITKKTILQKDRVPNMATIYYLEETVDDYGYRGSIWPGQVHEHGGVVMAGGEHHSKKHPTLRPVEVPNTKVKDVRTVDLINAMTISEPAPSEDLGYFSELDVSRNSSGPANGIFSFDLMTYAQSNLALAGMLENEESVLSSIEIKDIEIYSRLVGAEVKGNKLTPSKPIGCGLGKTNDVKRVASLDNNCTILDTPNNGDEILDISFTDDTVEKYTHNVVEYEAMVTMGDNSMGYVRNMMRELANSLRMANLMLKTGRRSRRNDEYSKLLDQYIAAVIFIKGPQAFAPFNSLYWKKNLLSMLYNAQRDTRLTSTVVDAIAGFVEKINKVVSPATENTSEVADYHSKIYMSTHVDELRAENVFENRLFITGPANYGTSIIDEVADYSKPAPSISFEKYNQRSLQETNKYQTQNPDSTLINRLAFLSPSYVGLGMKKSIDTKTLDIDTDAVMSMARNNLNRAVVMDNRKQNDDLSEKLEVMALAGVAIEPLKIPLKKLVITPEIAVPKTISSRKVLSRTTTFATQNRSILSGSQRSILRGRKKQNPSTTPVINSVVSSIISGYAATPKITNASNIEMSPMLKKAETDAPAVQESNALSNMVNFGSINQVLYLDSYSKKEGIKKQNWKTLDKKTFDEAQKVNRPLVCKAVKMSNTVPLNPSVNIGTMGSTFIIGEAVKKTTIRSPQRPLEEEDKLSKEIINMNPQLVYASSAPMNVTESSEEEEEVKKETKRDLRKKNRKMRGTKY
tara:strand:+ start:8481 stop:11150 length:2670 start_codon:yes stop_codon:yes gene_type:complete